MFTVSSARIVLGEDQGILREGLGALIEREPDAAVSGEAGAVTDGVGVLP
jgi:DNA-binding NarL/FixJ family response regulator